MLNTDELINQATQLPTADKWRLIKQLLQSLEKEQLQDEVNKTDWHEFLRETYGSLRDTPIQRW